MNESQHPAVVEIRRFIEPWRPALAEVLERPYYEAYPDDFPGPNDVEDVVINIRPRNDKAAPLVITVYANEVDRVDLLIVDRWSHLATLFGIDQPCGRLGDRVPAWYCDYGLLDYAKAYIQAVARGDVVVTAAISRRRFLLDLSTVTLLPDGTFERSPMVSCGVMTVARLLSVVGLAEVKTFRYEPWTS